ncbi:hypothetical protein CBS101457_004832 [Exobasidium rhododendri]|nr:hypothetical protein CBS101457_004832 [Exobasidium rhododendri]
MNAEPTQQSHQKSYSHEILCGMESARLDLPIPERAKLLVVFFMEQLEPMYECGDYDEIESWLIKFLERIASPTEKKFVQGDLTRLCLVMTMMAASIQTASESLIKLYFLESSPRGFSCSTLNRNIVKGSYESHVRFLLECAITHDEPSADLARCIFIYLLFLKNEGRHGETCNQPLSRLLSATVRQASLHLDPTDSKYTENEREARRRLFWAYYSSDRMRSAHLGFEKGILDEEITTKVPLENSRSPLLGKRNHLHIIYRIHLSRIAGRLGVMLSSGVFSAQGIQSIEDMLQELLKSLPPVLSPKFPPINAHFGQYRCFDLQRHIFHVMFDSVRGALHRVSFFPSELIPMARVTKSRGICVESALKMIQVQESLRMKTLNEHHLRCFYIPFFLLESAITLVLTSLMELGGIPSGKEVPFCISNYIKTANRGCDILKSLPHDFTPATQGIRLLSRILAKANQIIELHTHHTLTQMDSNTVIREVLLHNCEEEEEEKEEGKRGREGGGGARIGGGGGAGGGGGSAKLAFVDPATTITTISSPINAVSNKRKSSGSDTVITSKSSVRTAHSTSDQGDAAHSSSLTTPSDLASAPSYNKVMDRFFFAPLTPSLFNPSSETDPEAAVIGEPTYADFGFDFFNEMAAAIPNPFLTYENTLSHPSQQTEQRQTQDRYTPYQSMQDQAPPPPQQEQQETQNTNTDLDEQMDHWLASLQNFA